MPRIPRHFIKEAQQCYHIISRTTGQEFTLGELEKEYLMQRIKWLSSIYFVKVFTFCILSNHFHLLIQMQSGEEYSDEEIEKRLRMYYGSKSSFTKNKHDFFRKKWSDLSEYVKEIKQGFSVWYNRMNNRRGYFWSERFKSVVVENGAALVACMAYIDLNPVRAKVTDRPDDYRYCGLGYFIQSANKGRFLSLNLSEFESQGESPVIAYRRYIYEVGSLESSDGKRAIPVSIFKKELKNDYQLTKAVLFQYRSRYFTESMILGSKGFVMGIYSKVQPYLQTRKNREPFKIKGVEGIYSLRRLREAIN